MNLGFAPSFHDSIKSKWQVIIGGRSPDCLPLNSSLPEPQEETAGGKFGDRHSVLKWKSVQQD